MPFIPALDCALVEVIGNQSGQVCEFTLACLKGGGYDLAALTALAGAVDGWVNTDLLEYISEDVTYEGVTVRGLSSDADIVYELSEPLAGLAAAPPFPAQVAVCITKRSAFTGKSQRGRLYLWGIQQGARLDDRHITDAFVTAFQTSFNDLQTVIDGTGWSPVILSYVSAGVPRVSAQITPLDHFQVRDNRLDTQRRRLGKS